MPNAKDLKTNPYPKILVVGDGGSRKTRFLATCPQPFVLDFDKGMAAARDMDVEFQTFKDAPFGVKVKKEATLEEGIYPWGEAWPGFIKYLNEQVWPKIEVGEWPFKTLGGDSITTMANICMNYVLRSGGKTGDSPIEVQHWGSQLRLMERVIEQLCSWPVQLVFTAHVKRDENLVTADKELLPLVGGQLSGKIGIYFDEVWFTESKGTMESKTPWSTLHTESSGMRKQAKTRHGVPSGTLKAEWSSVAPFFSKA